MKKYALEISLTKQQFDALAGILGMKEEVPATRSSSDKVKEILAFCDTDTGRRTIDVKHHLVSIGLDGRAVRSALNKLVHNELVTKCDNGLYKTCKP